MTTCITFTVPGCPQPKERARTVTRNGKTRTFTPKRTIDYEAHVKQFAIDGLDDPRRRDGRVPWKLDGNYVATLHVFFPDRRRRDLDNVEKAIFDALNGVIWIDDSQIVEQHTYRHFDKDNPRVDVTVEAW